MDNKSIKEFIQNKLCNKALGAAYAIWTGSVRLIHSLQKALLFHERAGALQILCVALILAGIVGLKLLAK